MDSYCSQPSPRLHPGCPSPFRTLFHSLRRAVPRLSKLVVGPSGEGSLNFLMASYKVTFDIFPVSQNSQLFPACTQALQACLGGPSGDGSLNFLIV